MAATKTRDLGAGSVPKLLAQLALPAVVAQFVNLLYNVVDRIYIGHMADVGAAALTGVGLFTPILMLITAFAMLCGSGGAPRAAIAMGRGDIAAGVTCTVFFTRFSRILAQSRAGNGREAETDGIA